MITNQNLRCALGSASSYMRRKVSIISSTRVLGKPLPKDDPDMSQLKTRAQVVAFVKKCFDEGAEVIKAQGDAGMAKTVQLGDQLYRTDALGYDLIAHANEHYGQIVVYYRLNGLVPPESRPKK